MAAIGTEFKLYLPEIIPNILKVFVHDKSPNRTIIQLVRPFITHSAIAWVASPIQILVSRIIDGVVTEKITLCIDLPEQHNPNQSMAWVLFSLQANVVGQSDRKLLHE